MENMNIWHGIRRPYLEQAAEIEFDRAAVHRGHLILVNCEHPVKMVPQELNLLPVKHIQAIGPEQQKMYIEQICLQQLTALLRACQGLEQIVAVSGYRSGMEQRALYQNSVLERGALFTANYVARPNESEHQTGLAVDVGYNDGNVDYISPPFPDHGVCWTFKQLASKYGFIQRYKEGKEQITNIAEEPWHFRYVGFPHAVIIEQQGLCLEEYISWLKPYPFGKEHLYFEYENSMIEIYSVPAQAAMTKVPITKCERYQLSGNNVDGFIVTVFHEKGSGYVGI
jgi:zinc D-Ala-D-Ala dipeptidase/carboxypeptidase